MSASDFPIHPARFAEAIKDVPISSLHLLVLELRNAIAHLDYSNEQLLPYAEGSEAVLGRMPDGSPHEPDQDCIDAIKYNEEAIQRKLDRLHLLRAEVESRGGSWTEFQSREEVEADQAPTNGHDGVAAADTTAGGRDSHDPAPAAADGAQTTPHGAWTDGTFQTGVIRDGQAHTNGVAGAGRGTRAGGRLTDEELRQGLEELMRERQDQYEETEEEGLHL